MPDPRRARVVALARGWLGTPYRHGARQRALGADCTFFAVVYAEAGIIPPQKIAPYAPTAHLHRASGIYVETIERFAVPVDRPEPGDVVMYLIGREYSHGGVVTAWPEIVHADIEAGFVVLAQGDQGRIGAAPRRFYSFVRDSEPREAGEAPAP